VSKSDETSWLETSLDIVIALGTVGALIAALVTIALTQIEKRLESVSGVRGWMSWRHPEAEPAKLDQVSQDDVISSYPPGPEFNFVLNVHNDSNAFIYNVSVTLWPSKSGRSVFQASRETLMPGQSFSSVFPVKIDLIEGMFHLSGKAFGAELIFRDAGGRLWNRSVDGRLRRLKSFNWYRPWHVPHPLMDIESFPWYAFRAKWRYRWLDYGIRAQVVPKWWAVDIRWARWRYARIHHAVTIPLWNLKARWKARHEIAEDRRRNGLPIPIWIVDDFWKNAALISSHARVQRKQVRQQKKDDIKTFKEEQSTWRRINPHDG
jgi:hypothetical protein